MMGSLVRKSFHGILWSAIERFSYQGIHFVIGVVLARMLERSDFGMIGMLSIFLGISQVFIDCGFSSALIRQVEATEKDYGTAFSVNLGISVAAYAALFMAAPWVEAFYGMPGLCGVMRGVSATLVLNALVAVQKVKLTRAVDFKNQSKVSLGAAVLSGGLGIALAYGGFGVWSLVGQSIANSALNLLGLTALMRWFPKPAFDRDSFRRLFGFGSRLLAASLVHAIYANLYNLVIGKRYSADDLGVYARADSLSQLPSQNVDGVLKRVTYPILAQLQNEPARLREIYIKYLGVTCFAVFPMMIGLAATARPLVTVLLGEKWLPCVPLLQVLCLAMMLDPVCSVNLNLLYVKGRSDLVLKLEVVKKIVALAILFAAMPFGVKWMCVGRAFYSAVATLLNMTYTRRFIDLSVGGQLKLMAAPLAMSSVMAAGCLAVGRLGLEGIATLAIAVPFGVAVYLGLSHCFHVGAFKELRSVLASLRRGEGRVA
jgi:O-antigen/teichoic acid export membrane protein